MRRDDDGATYEGFAQPPPPTPPQPKSGLPDFGQSKVTNSGKPEFGWGGERTACAATMCFKHNRTCSGSLHFGRFPAALLTCPSARLRTIQVCLRTWAPRARILDAARLPAASRSAEVADGTRLSYCEITGIVRRDGATDGTGSMRRRDFITLLGGAAAAWPLAARAQAPSRMRRIAWLGLGRGDVPSPYVDALRSGLRDLGWIEGRNLSIGMFWATGREDMEAAARDLIASDPEVIVTQELMTYAVQPLERARPVVFGFSGDPVDGKLVQSFARPGGNLTGMSYLALELVGKRIELLKEWLPQTRRIAILARPQHPGEHRERDASEQAIGKLGMQLSYFPIRDLAELDQFFRAIADDKCDALVVFPDSLMFGVSDRIARFASEARLPSVSGWSRFAENGLLLTYGPDVRDLYRSLARYVDRILRGAKPADLPVELPTKFELVINAKAAKSLGLEIPPMLLARADQLIQ